MKVENKNINGKRKDFVAGKHLIELMMKYQGEDLFKAVIEMLQNALDSKPYEILIFIDSNRLIIQDDGIGMSDEVIEKYFGVIGESTKRNDMDARGFFGIGVLQIMPYGVVSWKTLNKRVVVDVKEYGMTYEEIDEDEFYQGTQVELVFYESIHGWDIRSIIRKIKNLIYMPEIRININGESFSRGIKYISKVKSNKFEAFIEDDKISRLFSQGLYVKRMGSYGGVSFNSKIKLELNFARNAVIDSPEKKELYDFIGKVEESMISTKNQFSKETGLEVAQRFINGNISLDVIRNKKIVKTIMGRSYSIERLKKFDKIYFDVSGSKLGNIALQMGLIVLDKDYKRFFDVVMEQPEMEKFRVSIMSRLPAELMSDNKEQIVKMVEAIKNIVYQVYFYSLHRLNSEVFNNLSKREIKIGQSKDRRSWTDGKNYIIINKNIINEKRVFEEFLMDAYRTICHEYSHDGDSKDIDTHGTEFYERFHQILKDTCVKIGTFIANNRFATLRREAEDDDFLIRKK